MRFEEIASVTIPTGLGLDSAAAVSVVCWIAGMAIDAVNHVDASSLLLTAGASRGSLQSSGENLPGSTATWPCPLTAEGSHIRRAFLAPADVKLQNPPVHRRSAFVAHMAVPKAPEQGFHSGTNGLKARAGPSAVARMAIRGHVDVLRRQPPELEGDLELAEPKKRQSAVFAPGVADRSRAFEAIST